MYTPLISELKDKGTFITFQSAAEDLNFSLSGNTTRGMRFSHIACLDLPDIVTPSNNSNQLEFRRVESVFIDGLSGVSPALAADSLDLAQSLQNYMLNLEASVLSKPTYDPNAKLSVAERVFFKWLKEVGGIRFQGTSPSETSLASRFVEEADNDDAGSGDLYRSVVKYVGEIDITSSNRNRANTFNEIYVMIPSQHGSTSKVLFKTVKDGNYGPGLYPGQDEYIHGREADDDPSSAGLSVIAQYDVDVPVGSLNYDTGGDASVWFDQLVTSSDTNVYVVTDDFSNAANELITRTDGVNSIEYVRNRLEGVVIDLDPSGYKFLEDNPQYGTFNDINTYGNGGDFEFNAILLYYQVWDVDTPDDVTTNLYGILFLDDLEQVGVSGAKISAYQKVKPDGVIRKQGNAYGIRINLKFDVTADLIEPKVEVSVNDYNSFSMLLFAEAMEQVRTMVNSAESIVESNSTIMARLDAIEQLTLNSDNLDSITSELEEMRLALAGITPNQDLLTMISDMNSRIDGILAGNSSVQVDVMFNLIPTNGITINRDGGNLFIGNKSQSYSTISRVDFVTTQDQAANRINVIRLLADKPLYYHQSDAGEKSCEATLHLYIDDNVTNWANGQSLKVAFKTPVVFPSSHGIVIYSGNGSNDIVIGAIPNEEISTKKPVIEIVCINATTRDFLVTVS